MVFATMLALRRFRVFECGLLVEGRRYQYFAEGDFGTGGIVLRGGGYWKRGIIVWRDMAGVVFDDGGIWM